MYLVKKEYLTITRDNHSDSRDDEANLTIVESLSRKLDWKFMEWISLPDMTPDAYEGEHRLPSIELFFVSIILGPRIQISMFN